MRFFDRPTAACQPERHAGPRGAEHTAWRATGPAGRLLAALGMTVAGLGTTLAAHLQPGLIVRTLTAIVVLRSGVSGRVAVWTRRCGPAGWPCWLSSLVPGGGLPAGWQAALRAHRARLYQLGGWFGLGVLAFGAEVALLGLLHQWLKCPLWLASALAAECVLLARFLATDRLVFGHRRPALARCGRFHGAAVGSFAVSWLVLNGSAALLGAPYVAAAFLGSVAACVWSGLTNFLWVWRSPTTR